MKKRSTNRTPKLGQHFLTNPGVARSLVDAADVREGDTVLEIGPGTGALTRELIARGAHVIAIEKDEALAATFASAFPNVRLVTADVRDITPEGLGLADKRYILAANIPYYITGEIIRTFLTAQAQPKTIALLIQKEVAERIARSKKESILSLSVKAYGTPHFVKKVSAGNFSPPPSVDSAILAITGISRDFFRLPAQAGGINEHAFFTLVRAGFSSKRKKLFSNLSRVASREMLMQAFHACKLSENTRAEDVPIETWRELVRAIENATS